MSYGLGRGDAFDLFHPERPRYSGEDVPPKALVHLLTCSCEADLALEVKDGSKIRCLCGTVAEKVDGRIVMELA